MTCVSFLEEQEANETEPKIISKEPLLNPSLVALLPDEELFPPGEFLLSVIMTSKSFLLPEEIFMTVHLFMQSVLL